MQLVCPTCNEPRLEIELLRRSLKLPYTQSNIRSCRDCNKKRNRERYHANASVREKQAAASKAWREANPEKWKEVRDGWRRANLEKVRAYSKEFLDRNPTNGKARNKVAQQLRRGGWTKQPCEVCGTMDDLEAHHDSYAETHWLTVRWLCKGHHEQWHSVLDPVKKPMLTGLDEVEALRKKFQDLFEQSNRLREQARQVKQDADSLELRTWNEVQIKAQEMFPGFVKGRSK